MDPLINQGRARSHEKAGVSSGAKREAAPGRAARDAGGTEARLSQPPAHSPGEPANTDRTLGRPGLNSGISTEPHRPAVGGRQLFLSIRWEEKVSVATPGPGRVTDTTRGEAATSLHWRRRRRRRGLQGKHTTGTRGRKRPSHGASGRGGSCPYRPAATGRTGRRRSRQKPTEQGAQPRGRWVAPGKVNSPELAQGLPQPPPGQRRDTAGSRRREGTWGSRQGQALCGRGALTRGGRPVRTGLQRSGRRGFPRQRSRPRLGPRASGPAPLGLRRSLTPAKGSLAAPLRRVTPLSLLLVPSYSATHASAEAALHQLPMPEAQHTTGVRDTHVLN